LTSMSLEMTELYIVHAWSLYGESMLTHGRGKMPSEKFEKLKDEERTKRQQWLDNLVSDYRQTLDDTTAQHFVPKLELLHGDPVSAVPQKCREVDAEFMVIGTVSRTGVGGLLIGNTAEAILNHLNCSVMTIKPEDFNARVSAV